MCSPSQSIIKREPSPVVVTATSTRGPSPVVPTLESKSEEPKPRAPLSCSEMFAMKSARQQLVCPKPKPVFPQLACLDLEFNLSEHFLRDVSLQHLKNIFGQVYTTAPNENWKPVPCQTLLRSEKTTPRELDFAKNFLIKQFPEEEVHAKAKRLCALFYTLHEHLLAYRNKLTCFKLELPKGSTIFQLFEAIIENFIISYITPDQVQEAKNFYQLGVPEHLIMKFSTYPDLAKKLKMMGYKLVVLRIYLEEHEHYTSMHLWINRNNSVIRIKPYAGTISFGYWKVNPLNWDDPTLPLIKDKNGKLVIDNPANEIFKWAKGWHETENYGWYIINRYGGLQKHQEQAHLSFNSRDSFELVAKSYVLHYRQVERRQRSNSNQVSWRRL